MLTVYDATKLKPGDIVNYYGKLCPVLSVDKQYGILSIKEHGEKQFISFVLPRYCRKVRKTNA